MAATNGTTKPLNALVFCGPSGVGKGTLLKRLFIEYHDRFAFSVSHTTRAARPGEINGREYHFSTCEEVEQMRDRDEFLELCDVHGNYYGTSVAAVKNVEATGKICILEIDIKGSQKLRARTDQHLRAELLFITAPMELLRERILGRSMESEATVQRRLDTAEREYAFLAENPDYFTAVIENIDRDVAYNSLVRAINEIFAKHGVKTLPVFEY